MNAVFDTLAYAKKLQAAGVPEKVAEVHAEALAEVAEERLATKDDVVDLKKEIADVRRDMVSLEERLTHKIESVTYQLTIRLGSLLTAGIILVGTLHKLFN